MLSSRASNRYRHVQFVVIFEAVNPLAKIKCEICLLYTSDAADDMQCVDLGGRRFI